MGSCRHSQGGKPLREVRADGRTGAPYRQARQPHTQASPVKRRGPMPYLSRRGSRQYVRLPGVVIPEPARAMVFDREEV
jgi:hypothetical protein